MSLDYSKCEIKVFCDYENKIIKVKGNYLSKRWEPLWEEIATFDNKEEWIQSGIEKYLKDDDLDAASWFWHDMEESK